MQTLQTTGRGVQGTTSMRARSSRPNDSCGCCSSGLGGAPTTLTSGQSRGLCMFTTAGSASAHGKLSDECNSSWRPFSGPLFSVRCYLISGSRKAPGGGRWPSQRRKPRLL